MQKHYGYAFQWFALAALIAVLYVWFRLVRPRQRRRMRLTTPALLSFAVHSLPRRKRAAGDAQRTRRGRWQMLPCCWSAPRR